MAKYTSHPFVGKSHKPVDRVGRPKKPADMKKITVTMNEKQISRLDQISTSLHKSGTIIDRSILIRGIIDTVNETQIQEVIRKIIQEL